jgi:hypothetical protein
VTFRQHPLMEDARYQDAVGSNPVEQNVPSMLHAVQAGPHVIAGAAQLRVICEPLATYFKIVNVTDGLILSPGSLCIGGDIHQVGLGKAGQTVCSHQLALLLRSLKCLPNPPERISLGNSAGITCIERGSQRGKLRLKLLFLALQGAQRCADYLTGVVVPATFDLLQYEGVKLIRQIHISGRHGGPLEFQSEAQG